MKEYEIVLSRIGFSNSETQVYNALLKLGETKVGELVRLSKVSASNVHEACEKLLKKGVISFVIKNKIKHYYPIDPENLSLLIEKQQEELDFKKADLKRVLPEIKSVKRIFDPTQTAQVFLGLNGIKSAYKKLFEREFKDQGFLFFYKYDKLNVEMVHKFFKKLDIEDYYSNIPTKGIFSKEYEKYFKDRSGRNKIKAKFTDHPIPSSINIYGDKTLMISWSENPIAFLIESKEVTQTFEELFEEIWCK